MSEELKLFLKEVAEQNLGRLSVRAKTLLEASRPAADESAKPIDMVLFCPHCGVQHIDGEEWSDDPHDIEQGQTRIWNNPPHRSHLCHHCKLIWRPADVPTNGVASVKTKGRADSEAASTASKEAKSVESLTHKVFAGGKWIVVTQSQYEAWSGKKTTSSTPSLTNEEAKPIEDRDFSHQEVFGHLANDMFTSEEAVEYLEVSMSTFRRYVKDGKIKPSKGVGRSQLFSTSELREFKKALTDEVAKPIGWIIPSCLALLEQNRDVELWPKPSGMATLAVYAAPQAAIVASEEAKPLGYTTIWDIQQMAVGGVGSFFPEREEAEENIPLFTYPVNKEVEPIGYATQANLDVLAKHNFVQIFRDPEKGDIPVYLHPASKEVATLSDEVLDAAIVAYDKAWCGADRGWENKAGAIEAAFNAIILAQRNTSKAEGQ